MSYLIALYVYYHGNNLTVFGITKGAQDEDLNNSGLKHPDEINPNLVSSEIINSAKEQEIKTEKTEKELNWNELMKQSIQKAQQMTYNINKAGLISNTIYDKTPESSVESFEDEGSIPLDFFNSLNGF